METALRSRWFATGRAVLIGLAVAAAAVLALRVRHGVETDLYALADTRHGGILRELADGMAGQGRVLLEGDDFGKLKESAEAIRARFRQPVGDFKETLKFLAEHRAGLLSPETRELLQAGRYKDVSDAAIARLYGFVPPLVSVKEDPFLLATDYMLSMQTRRTAGWTLREGQLSRETNGIHQVLLTLDLSAASPSAITAFLEIVAKPRHSGRVGVPSPTVAADGGGTPSLPGDADGGGTPSLPGSSLETSTKHQAPSTKHQTWCGGPPFHAARATANATREINILSAVSLALVLLFGWLLFRSFRFVLPLVATLGVAFMVAAAVLFAAFPRPHVLTFVFGTSLIGLAVDYAYHVRAAGDARSVLRPLALSLLTTEACFAPLFFSVVPVLRQMALFTGTGLLAAFAWAVAWGSARADAQERVPPGADAQERVPPVLRILIVIIAACGLYRVRVSSDPASFYTPDRYLAESEKRLAACNPEKSGRFVFVRGRNVQEALEREEAAGIPGLSALIPSLARQRENVALVSKLHAAEGKAYMAKTGLRVVPTKEGALLDPDSIGDPYLAQMVRSMVVKGGIVSPCPDGFSSDDPNIVILEPKRAIEDMFATFSSATMKLLAWSLAVLAALLMVIFRRRSFGYVASLAATFAATAGMLGWLGVPVTFFTLLCFFAVAGLGLDYAIFTRSSAAQRVRQVVFFAFLTSFAGLGMLSFTDFAVTRAMGLTFACGLFFAWLCAGLFAGGNGVGQKTKDERQTESHEAPSTKHQARSTKHQARSTKHQAPAWHQQREQSAGRWRMLFMWYMYVWFGKSFQKILCIPVMAFIYPFARPARESLREFYKVLKEFKVFKDVKDFKDLKTGEPSSTKHQASSTKHHPSPFTLHLSPFTVFSHLLGFAWSLADKTDACTLRKNLPKMSVRDDVGWRAFDGLVRAGKGAFLISTHLGTIEVFPALEVKRESRKVKDDVGHNHPSPFTLHLSPSSSPFTFHHSPFVHAFQQMGHDAVFTEVFSRHLDSSRLALHPVEEIGVETAVRMQEAIGRGELVLMAGDRVSAGSERVLRHNFLGRPCVWPKGVFVFAKLMEAPIFFVTCVRTGWNAYEVHVREFVPSGEPLLPSLLDAYVRFLEEETLAHPEQWYQFYRFFEDTTR